VPWVLDILMLVVSVVLLSLVELEGLEKLFSCDNAAMAPETTHISFLLSQ